MTPDYLDNDDIRDLAAKELDEMVKFGIVQVVGINDDGTWLYALSAESRKIIAELGTDNIHSIVDALVSIMDDLRGED